MVSVGANISRGISAHLASRQGIRQNQRFWTKKMVCFHPQYIYQRRSLPIECGKDEKLLHHFNKPSFKYNANTFQTQIPCGKCIGCILDKASDWSTRLWCEQQMWKNNCFITLTYNNGKRTIKGQEELDSLPRKSNGMMTLNKEDIILFKKRLRKHCKGIEEWKNERTEKIERPIRTFECGEYGPKGGRPHYHMVIFNWKPNDLKFYKFNHKGQPLYTSKFLQKIWGCGFVVVGELEEDSASYTARYTMKKVKEAKTFRKYYWKEEMDTDTGEVYPHRHYKTIKGQIEPEFLTMSRGVGIGKKYFEKEFEMIYRNNGIYVNGKLKRIPRYFKKVWEKKDWEQYHRWKWKFMQQSAELAEEKIKQLIINNNWTFEQIEWWYLKNQEKSLLDKAKSLKRDHF